MKKILIVLFLLSLTLNVSAKTPLKTAIQIYTTVSQGGHSIEETAAIAERCGLDAVVFTDRDILYWEYGFPPLKNILKKTVQQKSIFSCGPEKYLTDIDTAQKNHPKLLLIPGTESAPFYCWKGVPFARDFGLYDWDKHFVTIGMQKSEDYKNLPVIGNGRALNLSFNPALAWPLWAMVIFLVITAMKAYSYTDSQGRPLGKPSRYHLIIFVILIIFAVNNYPFRNILFDQYDKKNERKARQNYIDYVNNHGGLTFWAHPEASNTGFYNGVYFETKPHPYELTHYHNYTGYCIFYDGYEILGKPEGLWDEMLVSFCQGKRDTPVWVIGGCSIEKGDYVAALRDLHTGIFCKNSRKDLLRALREGQMYVARGLYSLDFTLNEFSLDNNILKIKGSFTHGKNLSVTLIEYGKILQSYEVTPDFNLEIPVAKSAKKSYYRMEIKGDGLQVVTNPVFTE